MWPSGILDQNGILFRLTSQRVSRTLFLRCSGSLLAVPCPFLLPPFVSPLLCWVVFLMVQCCFLWYWLGIYRKLQQSTIVSQKHLFQHQNVKRSQSLYAECQFHQVLSHGRAFSSQVIQYMWLIDMQHLPSFGTSIAFPFGRSTWRALGICHLALDLSSEEQATLPAPCTLWEAASWFGFWFVQILRCCSTLYPMFWRHPYPFVADRRATARTTETLSHAAISQKKWPVKGSFLFLSKWIAVQQSSTS